MRNKRFSCQSGTSALTVMVRAAIGAVVWTVMSGASTVYAGSTTDELARIEAEHVVLKAKQRLTETRAQIAARQAEIDRQSPYLQDGLPAVLGVEGLDRRMSATLALENGAQADVVVGDVLPGGARVASITATSVTVRTPAGKQVRLKAAGDAAESGRLPAPTWPGGRVGVNVGAVGPGNNVPALMPMVRPSPSPSPSTGGTPAQLNSTIQAPSGSPAQTGAVR